MVSYSAYSQEEASERSKARAKTVQVLLEYGADVTARDDTRSTPLHLALSTGAPEIAQLLIEHGADVNALDRNRQTPLHLSSLVSVSTLRDRFSTGLM